MPAHRLGLVLAALLAGASPAAAHYHLFLPAKASAERGEVFAFTYQFGRPFEHGLPFTDEKKASGGQEHLPRQRPAE